MAADDPRDETPATRFGPSYRLGASASCDVCQSGKLISFNWAHARDRAGKADRLSAAFQSPNAEAFELWKPLRFGALYRCKTCSHPWHLDGDGQVMSSLDEDRVPLILRWSEHPILLRPKLVAALEAIGPTPPDIYGNGSQYRETPCGVVTMSGERIELATISFQRHAPFERGRHCRLGSEIAEIYRSPYALPLDVRIASAKAEERRMGLYPTAIETPAGKVLLLNGSPNFLVRDDCRGDEARLSRQQVSQQMPEIVAQPKGVIYFVADG